MHQRRWLPILAVLLALTAWATGAQAGDDPWRAARQRMVSQQIQARGVMDPLVLRAMEQVPRHLFVPPAWLASAYADHALPIGQGQTISQPFIVAHMTELLALKGGERVLEIGTGSGYQAAVLSLLAGEVYSIELVPELCQEAAERLAGLGYAKVRVRCGDGYQGWPEAAPFQAIMVTAAAPEVPPLLVEQLAPGGRLLLPLGPAGGLQFLVLVEKTLDGRLVSRELDPVRFVPLVPGGAGGRP
ncbi:MAG: protein-L-isoaspartate(D-aspartate) O-methyltransferase [Desulfarculus sp.]|nr:protein-L-isoaspartate(D-aspartate) O-methyltransferase [Desulfarculus sp.]